MTSTTIADVRTIGVTVADQDDVVAFYVTVGDVLRWDGVPPMYTFDDRDGNRFTIVEEMR